ncbi:sensor histidine kinase [Wenyingzhuangia sp. IMCC45467]
MNQLNSISKSPSTVFIHMLIWGIFFAIIAIQFFLKFNTIPYDFYIRTIVFVGLFYLNYSILVPNLLLNNKIILYAVVATTFFLLIIYVVEPLIPHSRDLPVFNEVPPDFPKKLDNPNFKDFRPNNNRMMHPSFPIFLLVSLFFALSTSIRLALEWYKKEKERVVIQSQKVNSELSFLKAQLNPHFLFNTLNSIYSLANKKSDDTTEAVVTLSELMRYMIYEANENLVPLEKEVEHIKNYIALQLLRVKDSSGVRVNIQGDLNYKIEPLLLISFIENAFKYGTDFKGKTEIRIKINIINNELHFYTYNISSPQNYKSENSGVGLENIKNRLHLLYPNSHNLEIINNGKSYEVKLIIKLKKANK